jgi:uncharacterized membrane protein
VLLKHRNRMLRAIDIPRVRQAIVEAERETSGEIRVSVAAFFWGDVQKAAARAFERMGMTATRQRNGVLFFLVPARRRFAVLGDEGIHARMGPEFWEHVTGAVAEYFVKGDFTGGLVHGIETVGRELATHFPPDPEHPHELTDEVDLGK